MNFIPVSHSEFFIKQLLSTVESTESNVEDPFDGISASESTGSM